MDIRQLQYFAAVVEEGTISAAARSLHVAQPSLSYQIGLLEAEYGVRLFDRGARQITLTDAGNLLYRYATEILELTHAADDDMKSLHSGQKGTIRLGLISSADAGILYQGFKAFHTRLPNVQFKVYEGNTYTLLDQLSKGKIELAVIRTPFPEKDLDCIPLAKDPMAAAGLPDHAGSRPAVLCLKDLQHTPLIIYRRWEKILKETCEQENFHPDIFCVNEDARTSLEWAAAGLGTAIVPASILHFMPGLPFSTLQEENLVSTLCLVRRHDVPLSMRADTLYRVFLGLSSSGAAKNSFLQQS